MKRLHTYAAVGVALFLSACASPWQTTYAGASAVAEYVDTTHMHAWSEPLREQVDECDKTLPSTATGEDILSCLGPYAENPQVVEALERYNALADVLAAVLLATDPEAKDQSGVLEAWADVLAAARDLLALFPEGDKFIRQFDTLTRKAKP